MKLLTLGERIKKVRKELDITQQKFAERIGTTQNTIANYETNHRKPSAAAINNICKTFNVSEKWLRAGEGEMFIPETSFNLDEYIKRHGATELEIEILKAYFDLDSYMREKLLKHFKERLKIIANKPNISTVAARPSLEDEARAEAEEYYRAILAEKEAAAGLSASSDSISGAKLA